MIPVAPLAAAVAALVPDTATGNALGTSPGTVDGHAWPLPGAHRAPPESPVSERLALADGRCAHLRPVRPTDMQAAQAFVSALSPRSRRARFHGALKRLPFAVLRQMTTVDFHDHVAWVAEAGCDDGPARLVAEARYVRAGASGEFFVPRIAGADEGGAEFALAVADDWQGQGLGRALLQRLVVHARQRGLAALHGLVLADNEPMLALLRRLGAEVRGDPFDATLVKASLTL